MNVFGRVVSVVDGAAQVGAGVGNTQDPTPGGEQITGTLPRSRLEDDAPVASASSMPVIASPERTSPG